MKRNICMVVLVVCIDLQPGAPTAADSMLKDPD